MIIETLFLSFNTVLYALSAIANKWGGSSPSLFELYCLMIERL